MQSWGLLSPKWIARNSQRELVGLVDQLSAFACGLGSPRTNVLGHSQPCLRDWSRWGMCTQACVLGSCQSPYGTLFGEPVPTKTPKPSSAHSCFVSGHGFSRAILSHRSGL